MGVLHGRDIFNSKWITAEITDAASRIHYVPIKKPIGDYFLTEIEDMVYVFKIDGSRIKTYRQTLVKSFRILQYDISHYLPIGKEVKELELVLEINSLPKVNSLLQNIFMYLGRREKTKTVGFTPHQLKELIEELGKQEDQYSEQIKNILGYLDHLHIEEIVTPLRGISEFIEGDLKATDPNFLGSIIDHFQRTDIEHKKVTNTPITSKTAWIKIIALFAMIGMIGAVGFIAYEQGAFDSIASMIPSLEFEPLPASIGGGDFMSQYPDPLDLKIAIEKGEVSYDSLPPDIKNLVDNIELPNPDD